MLVLTIQDNIRHLVMDGNLKSKLRQLLYVLQHIFLYSVTHIQAFGTRGKPWSELFNDSFLQLVMLAWAEGEVLIVDPACPITEEEYNNERERNE